MDNPSTILLDDEILQVDLQTTVLACSTASLFHIFLIEFFTKAQGHIRPVFERKDLDHFFPLLFGFLDCLSVGISVKCMKLFFKRLRFSTIGDPRFDNLIF
jgi:hypothetical protein